VGFVMHQGLELGVWLGMAGLAVIAAYLLLWRTRRVLRRSRQDVLVQDVRLVPSARTAPTVPTALTESVSSVIAS
jgi:hypothetical protein